MRYLFFLLFTFLSLPLWSQHYERFRQLEGHYGQVTFVVFHHQEELLVSGDKLGQILVWDIATGEILQRFLGHQGSITHLEFDATSTRLLSAAYDGTCLIWSFETGEILQKIKNSSTTPYATVKGNEPTFALWGENESTIIYGGYNRIIHQFDTENAAIETLFTTSEGGITCGDLSLDEQSLLFAVNEKIYLYDINQQQVTTQLTNSFEPNHFICELSFVPKQDNLIAAWTFGGQVQIWNVSTKRIIKNITASDQQGSSYFAFSKDGQWLVTGNNANEAIIWQTTHWQQAQTLKGHTKTVKAINFALNNKYIATGSDDKTIIIWRQTLSTPTLETIAIDANLQTAIDHQRPLEVQETYTVQGEHIKISIADDAQEDGDILSLIFNGQVILDTYQLEKRKKILKIPMTQKENYLVVYAHNEGSIPPNTIAIKVESLYGQKDFKLRSNMNTSAALKIMLED